MTIYEDFGYVAVNSNEGGIYYGMGVSLSNLNLDYIRSRQEYQIRFVSTFPAKVEVKILTPQKKILKQFYYEQMRAGQQEILWDGLTKSGKKIKGKVLIEVSAKATYSMVNLTKVKKIFELK